MSYDPKKHGEPPSPKTGTFFVLEEVPFDGRRRRYCHWDGADAPSFDDLERAVAWGLDRAAGVVIRTLDVRFYLAGERPTDWGQDLDLLRWPPSRRDRLQIDDAFAAAVAAAAQDEIDQHAYEEARTGWLAVNAPHLLAVAPAHECALQIGDSDDLLAFEELSADGNLCGCRVRGPGRWAFGAPAAAIREVLGYQPDDPWLAAILATLDHDRAWSPGEYRQQVLSVGLGQGEMFHVSAVENRGSIKQYGLDWRRIAAVPGIAGARTPEAPAVFPGSCIEEAEFFVEMASPRPVDVWARFGRSGSARSDAR